jgi:Protein of unknown function (DUF3567)
MQMLYQSEQFVVVQFDAPAADPASAEATPLARGGFEIVDKHAGREIYLEGLLAEHFKQGVQHLVDTNPTEEAFDAFIGGFSGLAHQPLLMH